MKKLFLSIGVLALLGIGFVATACSKDDISKGCDCTYKIMGISSPATHFEKEDVEAAGASTCSGFEKYAEELSGGLGVGGSWTCTSTK